MGPQETDPDVPECPEISSEGVGQQWPAARFWALSVVVGAWDLLKERGHHYLHYLHHSLAPGK